MGSTSRPPKWIKPQLTLLVDYAPTGDGWLHEIKYDGYRMHARIDDGSAAKLGQSIGPRLSVQLQKAGIKLAHLLDKH